MAAKKPPKQKELKIEVPDFGGYEPESVDDYKETYNQKPLGSVDVMSSNRPDAIEELYANKMQYLDTKSDLLKQYNDKSTDWGDIIAEALLTLGPTIAGYALDKNQGGIYGANIGLQVGGNYRKQRQEDKQFDRYAVGKELENIDSQISAADKLRQEYFEKELALQDQKALRADDREFEFDRDQRKREEGFQDFMRKRNAIGGGGGGGGGGRGGSEVSPEMQEDLRAQLLKIDPSTTIPSATERQLKPAEFKYWLSKLPKAPQKKPIPAAKLEKLDDNEDILDALDRMEGYANQMGDGPTAGLEYYAKTGQLPLIGGLTADPDSPDFMLKAEAGPIQQKLAKQSAPGAVSDQESKSMEMLVSGQAARMGKSSVLYHLNVLRSGAAKRAARSLETYKASKYFDTGDLEALYEQRALDREAGRGGMQQQPVSRAESGQLPVSSNVPLQVPTLGQFGGDKQAWLQALKQFNAGE
jgi:hypothetical protein